MILLPDKTQTPDAITLFRTHQKLSLAFSNSINHKYKQPTPQCTRHIQDNVSYPHWCTGVSTHSDAEGEGDLQTACGVQGIL